MYCVKHNWVLSLSHVLARLKILTFHHLRIIAKLKSMLPPHDLKKFNSKFIALRLLQCSVFGPPQMSFVTSTGGPEGRTA